MKKIILFLAIIFCFTACYKKAESVKESTNTEFNVEKLFTVDSITVYRFSDGGCAHYFTKDQTFTSYTIKSGKYSHTYTENIATK